MTTEIQLDPLHYYVMTPSYKVLMASHTRSAYQATRWAANFRMCNNYPTPPYCVLATSQEISV